MNRRNTKPPHHGENNPTQGSLGTWWDNVKDYYHYCCHWNIVFHFNKLNFDNFSC